MHDGLNPVLPLISRLCLQAQHQVFRDDLELPLAVLYPMDDDPVVAIGLLDWPLSQIHYVVDGLTLFAVLEQGPFSRVLISLLQIEYVSLLKPFQERRPLE